MGGFETSVLIRPSRSVGAQLFRGTREETAGAGGRICLFHPTMSEQPQASTTTTEPTTPQEKAPDAPTNQTTTQTQPAPQPPQEELLKPIRPPDTLPELTETMFNNIAAYLKGELLGTYIMHEWAFLTQL